MNAMNPFLDNASTDSAHVYSPPLSPRQYQTNVFEMARGMHSVSKSEMGKATIGEYGVSITRPRDTQASCLSALCGCLKPAPRSSDPTHETDNVSFHNILYSENTAPGEVELTYAVDTGRTVAVRTEVLGIGFSGREPRGPASAGDISQHILARAYPDSKPRPRILVILNSHGGQGNAHAIYRNEILPVLEAAQTQLTFLETAYSGHAAEIARTLDVSQYDTIACCSGDGVPHEVINGFFTRADRADAFEKIAITQLPCGSGNALSHSSHGTGYAGPATVRMLKLARARMDAMAVTQGQTTKLSFLLQAYGVIADSDIGTEHLRWMGSVRFEFGVIQRLVSKTAYPCDLYVKYAVQDGPEIQRHYTRHRGAARQRLASNGAIQETDFKLKDAHIDEVPPPGWEKLPASTADNLNILYVGNMPYMLGDAQFFPAALPDDGCMDMVITTAKTSFFKMAKVLFAVDKGTHVHSPEVLHAKISGYKLVPRVSAEQHYISIDGENFPFEPLQVEVLSKVLTVLLPRSSYVDTGFSHDE